MRTTDWLSFAVSFAAVLATLGALLYLIRRVQQKGIPGLPQRRIHILESASVGPRQKLVLLRVNEQDLLIGVSPQQISTLASFASDNKETPVGANAGTAAGKGDEALEARAKQLSDKLNAGPGRT